MISTVVWSLRHHPLQVPPGGELPLLVVAGLHGAEGRRPLQHEAQQPWPRAGARAVAVTGTRTRTGTGSPSLGLGPGPGPGPVLEPQE